MSIAYNIFRKILFKLDPEVTHDLSLKLLGFMPRCCFAKIADAPITLWNLNFPNRIGLAAGLDKNGDYIDGLSKLGFGFIEVGTVTPKAQMGNPKPRLFRLVKQHALINRMGFNNKGVDYLISRIKKSHYQGILGINIGKNFSTPLSQAVDDYIYCLTKVYPYASYIVINISSPNTPGLRELQYGEHLRQLISALVNERQILTKQFQIAKPLLLKISPDENHATLQQIASIILEYGIDGVIATNTSSGREGVQDAKEVHETGGLSGRPILNLSNSTIKYLHELLQDQVPIIGVGGIDSTAGACEKFAAGAKLIQVYSGLIYEGPGLPAKLSSSLACIE